MIIIINIRLLDEDIRAKPATLQSLGIESVGSVRSNRSGDLSLISRASGGWFSSFVSFSTNSILRFAVI